MARRIARCQVVEVPAEQVGSSARMESRDLLPWADPYIARLMIAHRLEVDMAERRQSTMSSPTEDRPRLRLRRPSEW
jgi:hypothetical protein